MIRGLGIDLVEIERVQSALDRHGERFALRILSDSELPDYRRLEPSHQARFVAKRFAVKEAFSKALGLGIGRGFGFHDVWVEHTDLGQPQVRVNAKIPLLGALNVSRIHLSITDERSSCAAVCVIED